jgi:phosphatidylserine/phosphatidylglycerophosphate/cardiolipin synthase-like enzyme
LFHLNERFFPAYEAPPGDVQVAVLYDNSMVWDRAPTAALLVELVEAAETEIDIMTPFPNFESVLTDALIEALERGVRVRIFTNDREAAIRGGWIRLAAFPTLIELVEAGAEVLAWKANPKLLSRVAEAECAPAIMPPVALHGKVVRVDDELTIVHSSNFNIRSIFYNTEAGVAVLDHDFNRQMEELLDGLVTLTNFEIPCTNSDRQVVVDQLVKRLGSDDVTAMRSQLGGQQRFLDGMSMLW